MSRAASMSSVIKNTFILFLMVIGLTVSVNGQTVTVTTCDDAVDIPYQTGTIPDLPGPDGLVSLMEALIATDNTPGHQTIEFAIPESEWYLPNIYPGQVVLYSMLGWSASDSVTIDGTTQTAFTGNTFPDGNELMLHGLTLFLLKHLQPAYHIIEIDQVGVEFRTVDAGQLHLPLQEDPASAAHPRSVDHDGVQAGDGGDLEGPRGLGDGLHHDRGSDGDDAVHLPSAAVFIYQVFEDVGDEALPSPGAVVGGDVEGGADLFNFLFQKKQRLCPCPDD